MPENVQALDQAYQEAYQNASDTNAMYVNAGAYNPIGSLFGYSKAAANEQSLLNSYMQNAFNSSEAAKSRNWQEMMSNTSYQRAAKDLAAVGFSPFALLGSSSGASSGSSSVARSGSGAPNSPGSGFTDVINGLIKVVGVLAGKQTPVLNVVANSSDNSSSSPVTERKWTKKDDKEWDELMNFLNSY